MKQEQLLQAIGGVSEDMLMESELQTRRSGRTVRRILMVAAAVAALTVTAMASAGLFSRPIGETAIVTDETVAPFDMDAEGNIIPGGVAGQKIAMEVQIDPDPPQYLEEIYHLEVPDTWQTWGGAGGGGLYTHSFWETNWRMEGKPGELRLLQSVATNYLLDVSGENVVDLLYGLPQGTQLTTQKVTMAGLEMLKLTIPELPGFTKDHQFCPGGETRLYWSDGRYLLQLDYPYWVTDSEAEALLQTLNTQEFILTLPEDYGRVNVDRLAQLQLSIDGENTGTTMANSVMGEGGFVYSDGKIYYSEDGILFSYDPATGETQDIPLPDKFTSTFNMFATEDYICYANLRQELYAWPKSGGTPEVIYQGLGTTDLFADGMLLYTTNGMEYLSRIDLQTGEEVRLVEYINSYYVDDTYIYAVQSDLSNHYFLRSRKDNIDFEKIPLSFYPIKVLAHGEDLYFCEGGENRSYQVIRYRDGVETRLPLRAYDYQVLSGKLIYRDCDDQALKTYDLETGEIRTLLEHAVYFSILEDRYLCCICSNKAAASHYVLDLQTGTTTPIKTN